MAVENLRVGDWVMTHAGELRPVRWLGSRRLDCTRYKDPAVVWPIRILSGAFADKLPARDLWVSPGHSVLIEGALIQAGNLVNGVTVMQVPREAVEYWHVELESHDILLSEGLPTESYLDTGNRTAFVNGGDFLDMYPDFKTKHWAETCVPLVLQGPEIVHARHMLLARANDLGYVTSDDANLHLVADAQRIDPIPLGADRVAFVVPVGAAAIELRCRTFVPAHIDPSSEDRRELGVCVSRIQIDGADLALHDDAAFNEGWHELERYAAHQQRWTRERVLLPAGTRLVLIDIASRGHYWSQPHSTVVNLFG